MKTWARSALDNQAEAIALEVEARLLSRKSLGALAKAAKRRSVEEGSLPAAQVDTLVSAFKTEVDAGTARAKAAEGYFLSLYRALRDDQVRDPAVTLRRCAELGRASLASLHQRAEATDKLEARAEVGLFVLKDHWCTVSLDAVCVCECVCVNECFDEVRLPVISSCVVAQALVGRLGELGLNGSSVSGLDAGGAVAALEVCARILDGGAHASYPFRTGGGASKIQGMAPTSPSAFLTSSTSVVGSAGR